MREIVKKEGVVEETDLSTEVGEDNMIGIWKSSMIEIEENSMAGTRENREVVDITIRAKDLLENPIEQGTHMEAEQIIMAAKARIDSTPETEGVLDMAETNTKGMKKEAKRIKGTADKEAAVVNSATEAIMVKVGKKPEHTKAQEEVIEVVEPSDVVAEDSMTEIAIKMFTKLRAKEKTEEYIEGQEEAVEAEGRLDVAEDTKVETSIEKKVVDLDIQVEGEEVVALMLTVKKVQRGTIMIKLRGKTVVNSRAMTVVSILEEATEGVENLQIMKKDSERNHKSIRIVRMFMVTNHLKHLTLHRRTKPCIGIIPQNDESFDLSLLVYMQLFYTNSFIY